MVLNWVPWRCHGCSILIAEVVSMFPASDYLSVVSMDLLHGKVGRVIIRFSLERTGFLGATEAS